MVERAEPRQPDGLAPARGARHPDDPNERERPGDSAERLVVFTDAIVAIAVTLLVLPLVDAVTEGRRNGLGLRDLLLDSLGELGAFALSFLVIFRFWWAHHSLFRHVSRLNRALVILTVVWTFSIVFMPVPTALITAYDPSPGTVALYTGTLVVTSGALTLMALTVHRDPSLSAGRAPHTREELLGGFVTLGALLLALVLGTVFVGSVNYKALLLLALSGPVEHLVKQRWARREASAASPAAR